MLKNIILYENNDAPRVKMNYIYEYRGMGITVEKATYKFPYLEYFLNPR